MATSKKILIVSGDCPSHPYACVKLATVLAEHHEVTVAGPTSMMKTILAETGKCNESTTRSADKSMIKCVSIGAFATVTFCNVRPVIDPYDYSPIDIITRTLFDRTYNPFGLAEMIENVMDDQIDTYDNIKALLPEYELVYAVHSVAPTVFDASEALVREGIESPSCVMFSSLPYESSFIYKGLWWKPRSLTALPHVATYSSARLPRDLSFLALFSYLIQLFWMWLDTYHTERAWKISAKRNDDRRAERGLPPVYDGYRYYWMKYPVLSLGGKEPYITNDDIIAPNATVVGSIQSTKTSDLSRLDDWFTRANFDNDIIYACFGTGTLLSEEEARNITLLGRACQGTKYHLLLSQQKDNQDRLRHVFDEVLGEPTKHEDDQGIIEYMNGLVRIDCNVPQENLLLSRKVAIFVSHMGFGAFSEAIRGGVSMVAYPSGCDQWYNAERSLEAGIAVRAQRLMKDLSVTVFDAIENNSLEKQSQQLALEAAKNGSNQIILNMVKELCADDGETVDTVSSTTSSVN
jgi:hypothetical protein